MGQFDLQFSIDHNQQTFQTISVFHTHSSLEVMFCLSDGGSFCIDNQIFPLYHGTLVIVPSGTSHHCVVDSSTFDRYTLRVPEETLAAVSTLQTDFSSVITKNPVSVTLSDPDVKTLTQLIESCLNVSSGFGGDLEQTITFLRIMLLIGRILRRSPKDNIAMTREYRQILPAIEYITKNYTDDIRVETLAKQCYMSQYYFTHVFKSATGFSVKSYIANYRIRQSCALLLDGMSVQNAGSSVGYDSSAYFVQVFRSIVGVPPGKYAKTHINVSEL